MKQYHTDIVISAPAERIWQVLADFEKYPEWNPLVGWLSGEIEVHGSIKMFIKPLNRPFSAKFKSYTEKVGFTWVGIQFSSWFLSGEHYYHLEEIDAETTRLLHGEYFRGLGAYFIGSALLSKMESAFEQHNQILKEMIENE